VLRTVYVDVYVVTVAGKMPLQLYLQSVHFLQSVSQH